MWQLSQPADGGFARNYRVLFDKARCDTYCEILGSVLPEPLVAGGALGLESGQCWKSS